jgi:hypothetical protein
MRLWILAAAACLSTTLASAQSPQLRLERELNTGAQTFFPTYSDYNGDGVDDLVGRVYANGAIRMRLLSGVTGATIWQYDPPASGSTFMSAVTIPDVDGDGKREIVLGGSRDVWAVNSSSGGGPIDTRTSVFAFHNLSSDQFLATNDHVLMMASGDYSQVQMVDVASGQVRAQIYNNVPYGGQVGSLGQSAVCVGDLNGDGIGDFASSGGNVQHGNDPMGSVFLINGAVTTSSLTQLSSLPKGAVLGELSGVQYLGSASPTGAVNTTVNLGDPHPNDGQVESLIVSGSSFGNYQRGGISAHVLTRGTGGTLTSTRVANYVCADGQYQFGQELINIGDVNRDGVNDVAVDLATYPGPSSSKGRILIVSGAGLLDGYDPATDVLGTLDGYTDAPLYGSVQPLGDYDHDGKIEFGVGVIYNGHDGRYGACQQVYEAAPEPGSLALLAVGLSCVIARTIRRRKS